MLSDDLLELQRLDTTADQLANRRARLPEREPAAAADAELGLVRHRREQIAARMQELDAAIEALEATGKQLTAQRASLENKLKIVISPREAEALMHELDALRARHGELDDQELAHLEEQSSLADELAGLDAIEPDRQLAATGARSALAAAEAAIDGELAAVRASRDELAARLGGAVLARYEQLRRRFGGVGVAKLQGKRCTGCNLDLSASELDQVRATPPGETTDCPECGRLLVP